MNKSFEKLYFSENNEVGRDLSTINETKSNFFQHQKICKTTTDGGAENFDETEISLSNNKGGLFTMIIPLQSENHKIDFTVKPNYLQPLNVSKPQAEFSYSTPRLNTKTKRSIQLCITPLSSLRKKMTTNYYYISNLPWRLSAKTECTNRTGNVKFFSVYIDCNPESESTLWSCDAVVEFRLISQKSSGSADFTRQFTNKFSFNSNNWGFPSFMEWSEIINPDRGFVREDKVIVEAQITVQKVVGVRQNPVFDFSFNQAPISDGILLIDGIRLYISKPYLAMYSPVFHAMFYSKFVESEMKEISLEDVILKEFVDLLNVIYPSHSPITFDSVEYLLELGDKFEISFVIDECEKFLIKTNEISTMTKLVWADQYCLSNLHDVCMRTFTSLNEFKLLKNTEEFRNLSDTIKAAFLEKILKLL